MPIQDKLVENKADLLNENKTRVSLKTLEKLGYSIKHTYPDNISIAENIDDSFLLPKIIEIIDETKIEWKTWKNKNDQLHRESGPAVIYYNDDCIINKEWFLNNKNYSGFDNKASCLEFYHDKTLKKMIWTNQDGFFHSKERPAYFYYDKEKETSKLMWYTDGSPTRDFNFLHLPTIIYIKNKSIIDFEYYLEGINQTKMIKKWMNENNFHLNKIDKELFYINFVN